MISILWLLALLLPTVHAIKESSNPKQYYVPQFSCEGGLSEWPLDIAGVYSACVGHSICMEDEATSI